MQAWQYHLHLVPSFYAVCTAGRWNAGQVQCMRNNLLLVALARASLTSLLSEGLATAAAPVKGGFIREALTSHYPRLAALLEETFRRILQDTNVSCALRSHHKHTDNSLTVLWQHLAACLCCGNILLLEIRAAKVHGGLGGLGGWAAWVGWVAELPGCLVA